MLFGSRLALRAALCGTLYGFLWLFIVIFPCENDITLFLSRELLFIGPRIFEFIYWPLMRVDALLRVH